MFFDSEESIGFTNEEISKIFKLLAAILELGNISFDDSSHLINESTPCMIKGKENLSYIVKCIGLPKLTAEAFEKILLFEKKKFLKEYTSSAYSKNSCIANRNTLAKAIYNSIFEFILHKVALSIKPLKNKNYRSISILDIFGFENFLENSFEQLCINYTNEKLLKLYNKYVFEREMELLKEDGLAKEIS